MFDSVARFPWDHPHLEPLDGEDYSLPEGCVQYFIAGQAVVSRAHVYAIIIIKVFVKHKILSMKTVLSSYTHAPPPPPHLPNTHTHGGTSTLEHSDCAKLYLHSLKQAVTVTIIVSMVRPPSSVSFCAPYGRTWMLALLVHFLLFTTASASCLTPLLEVCVKYTPGNQQCRSTLQLRTSSAALYFTTYLL